MTGLRDIKHGSASATNAAASITIPGQSTLTKVVFSYSADPTGGALHIAGASGPHGSWSVAKAGPGPLNLTISDRDIVVTLAGGGSGVIGSLYAEWV